MNPHIDLFSVVALTVDLPARGLVRGQVGTVVELLSPDAYEVEFCDNNGQTYASLGLKSEQFMILHHAPAKSAS